MRAAPSRKDHPGARALETGWSICTTPAGMCGSPTELSASDPSWSAIPRLDSVAAALRSIGRWDLGSAPLRFDGSDWWYRLEFDTSAPDDGDLVLGFDGLATACEVWLDGEAVLTSASMFMRHLLRLVDCRAGRHELLLRFQSLDELLGRRKPRPRWRAPMVEHQQLRWWRTTLLGRTPGWSPPAAIVGPWRDVWIGKVSEQKVSDIVLDATLDDDRGVLSVSMRVHGAAVGAITVRVRLGDEEYSTQANAGADGVVECRITVPNARRWWPHTHGLPVLYDVDAEIGAGNAVRLGRVGFRTIEVDRHDGDFRVIVNGVDVFCRGSCWTPIDAVSLKASPDDYDAALGQVVDCGMNMVRVTGTMVYEAAEFFDVCDRLGILVWQDFMFANMDYPGQDADFRKAVEAEVVQVLADIASRPCLAVLCGNSEVEQQAAMWGAARECWHPTLFHEFIPSIVARLAPRIPYWPSSTHGGAFPHDPSGGTCSYYGVGAYRRPLADARVGGPRFATECLALANVPEQGTLDMLPGVGGVRVHQAIWRSRSPRDLGAGWDFDDIRDHYLCTLFGVDVPSLRYGDHERYLQLSRVVSGEVMAQTFSAWRSRHSNCRGALVLFQRDLWPGAGWGLVDSTGQPKAAWYLLRRTLQPLALVVTDEGSAGLLVHLINDGAIAVHGQLAIQLYRDGRTLLATGKLDVTLPPRSATKVPATDAFDVWHDFNYSYRFGPAGHDVVAVQLVDSNGAELAQASYFPPGTTLTEADTVELDIVASQSERAVVLDMTARRFLRCVSLELEGFRPDDNYFDLLPGKPTRVTLCGAAPGGHLSGMVSALNLRRKKVISAEVVNDG
jgi:beta-mannosidase